MKIRQSLFQRIFSYGSLEIIYGDPRAKIDEKQTFKIDNISKPYQLAKFIDFQRLNQK